MSRVLCPVSYVSCPVSHCDLLPVSCFLCLASCVTCLVSCVLCEESSLHSLPLQEGVPEVSSCWCRMVSIFVFCVVGVVVGCFCCVCFVSVGGALMYVGDGQGIFRQIQICNAG